MDPTQQQSFARWRIEFAHRQLWGIVMCPVLMLIVAVLMIRGDAEDPRKHFEESKREVAAFEPPSVPDAENASIQYKLAMKALVMCADSDGDRIENSLLSGIDGESSYFDRPEIQWYLGENEAAYQLTASAADMPKCNWHVGYLRSWANLPNLLDLRQLSTLLCAHARQKAYIGDHKGAARDVLRVRNLVQHMWRKPMPCIIMAMMATSFQEAADHTLQAILMFDPPSKAEELGYYIDSMGEEWDPFEQVLTNVCDECVVSRYYIDGIAAGELDGSFFRMKNDLIFFLNYSASRKNYVRLVTRVAEYAREKQLPPSWERLKNEIQCSEPLFPFSYTPNYFRSSEALVFMAEERRCIRAGLAVLQYRMKYRRDPQSLDALVPEFLPEVPSRIAKPGPLSMMVEKDDFDYSYFSSATTKMKAGTIKINTKGANWRTSPNETVELNAPVFYVPALKK